MRDTSLLRTEITLGGTVQGVGFRPFVYRLAQTHTIFGTILNNEEGVVIEAEGTESALTDFIKMLQSDPPPLARITSLHTKNIPTIKGFTDFSILHSLAKKTTSAIIPADISTCNDCLCDISDPENRRFAYPFTNCTNCGPRFSIVKSIPYDRCGTSMKSFPLCDLCRKEYEDPDNRRFHAQPNACPVCGPQLTFHDAAGKQFSSGSPLEATNRELSQGHIVAMRGLGGFHLVVDAVSDKAVNRLRKRKGRKSKPLAVMAADLVTASSFCHISKAAERLLSGPEHPIVLLPRKENCLAASLTPGINEIGVMLPYTPLHHLLFREKNCPQTLVMTSGNRSSMPIFTGNQEAVTGLSGIADCFLLHNREIVTRVDDSVVRTDGQNVRILRRARGYVPSATPLTHKLPPLLACGGGLKSTFCLTRDKEAFLSQHIGDLFNLESLDFYKESIYHAKRLLQISPEAVVCDLHPDYLSSRFAKESGLPLYKVQHHHAHAAAVLAEHGIDEKVLALVLDGTGLGDDNTSWGGEVLEADFYGFKRLGSLSPMLLPGGDAAAEAPWRMGVSLLHGSRQKWQSTGLSAIEANKQQIIRQMLEQNFNCPVTSSCGRFFDGIAALLGICLEADYEGQAAMEMEALAREEKGTRSLPGLLNSCNCQVKTKNAGQRLLLQQGDLLQRVLTLQNAGKTAAAISLDFHLCLTRYFFTLLKEISRKTGITKCVLTGGCMQNTMLLEGLFILLEEEGFTVFTGQNIPVNDGGIALGQAVIGGLLHVSGSTHESA